MTNEEALALKLQAVSLKMQREMKKHLFWGQFMSFGSTPNQNGNDPSANNLIGKPILVVDEIQKGRLGNMAKIPLTLDMAGPATYGSAAVTGREEPIARKYSELYVNTVRHAIQVEEGSMETFNERAFAAALDAVDLESAWHANQENWMVVTSIYEGLSENLTTSVNSEIYGQGRGFAKRYHPNLYAWTGASDSAAKLVRAGTARKFPTATEVFNAANASSNKRSFSTYTVEAARTTALKLGMRPIVSANGFKFFPWILTVEQAASLAADSRFQATINSQQWRDIKDHPNVKGSIGYYKGFLFFEDTYGIAVRGFSGTGAADLNILGSLEMIFDTSDKQNPRFLPQEGLIGNHSSDGLYNQVSIMFGESFLGKALGSEPEFRYREEDYGEWKGLACRAIYAYGRLDFVPPMQVENLISSPTSITGVYNRSSMLVMTYEKVQGA